MIHAVGPIYSGPQDEALLTAAYTSSLARADEVGARSIAFPAISTGVYGYPADDAARISVQALRDARTSVQTALLVAFGADTEQLWRRELEGV